MNTFRVALCSMAVASATTVAVGASAQAISFGIYAGNSSPTGATNQGAFSDFAARDDFATVTFNDAETPFQAVNGSGTVIEGFATYSYVGNNTATQVVPFGHREHKWAPDGANNEVNDSSYLQVFSGRTVEIQLAETLNYFGINWGSASSGNVFSFFKGDTMVGSFDVDTMKAAGFAYTGTQSNQGTGYVDFRSDGEADNFDRIVISQTTGGGFETDNHTFHVGTGKFSAQAAEAVPEPGTLLGLTALGLLGAKKILEQ